MSSEDERGDPAGWPRGALVALLGIAVVGIGATAVSLWLLVPAAVAAACVAMLAERLRQGAGLQSHQIERLRQAELALAGAGSTEAAARELADHAVALLGAPSATVLIEGIGDTVRVTAGESRSLYGDGSRMRLFDDAGVPCGSIAVSGRADGRAYTATQEQILDALAQRVSSTLHRLSLFAEVHAERRTLADVLESSSDGIFTVGLDLLVRSWNPAMARITGIEPADALGQPIGAVFRPVSEDGAPRHGTADPGRACHASTELVRMTVPAGDRWLLCSWSPLSEGGYVVVARDETERKKVQDDKDGWIAQVSHELRTPLTPIKGFLHTLQRRGDEFSAKDRQRIYDVMLREEQRLEDLVSGLLQATSFSRRRPEAARELVDLARLVEAQCDLAARADPTRAVEVDVPAGAVPPIPADPELLRVVLTSLLSNADKFSPPGGTIHVSVSHEGAELVTTVADEGPGVPPDDRERIFEKFTRLGDHLTRPQQGVGLGLYIARRASEQLGGRLVCEERPGGGALFRFTLPARVASAAAGKRLEQRPLRA